MFLVLFTFRLFVLGMGKKRKHAETTDDFEYDPIPRHLVTSHIQKQEKRLIIILENAQLETVKVSITLKLSKLFKCKL